jgi:hypothetical protein
MNTAAEDNSAKARTEINTTKVCGVLRYPVTGNKESTTDEPMH